MPSSYEQKDVEIDQGAAGTTELLAGSPGYRIRVLSYFVVMSLAGTYAFSDGTDWKTGDIPVAVNGGVAEAGTLETPLFECGVGRPLSITTTVGSAHGRARIEYR
jgi:hypothetical protein